MPRFFVQASAISEAPPANATKPLSFCCVRRGFLLDSLTSCPAEPLR